MSLNMCAYEKGSFLVPLKTYAYEKGFSQYLYTCTHMRRGLSWCLKTRAHMRRGFLCAFKHVRIQQSKLNSRRVEWFIVVKVNRQELQLIKSKVYMKLLACCHILVHSTSCISVCFIVLFINNNRLLQRMKSKDYPGSVLMITDHLDACINIFFHSSVYASCL